MMMGYSDYLILADANLPGAVHVKRLIRMDGIMIPVLLDDVPHLFPLDTFVPDPVRQMRNLPVEPVPEIWLTYRELLTRYDSNGAFRDFAFLDRLPFYEEAEKAYVIVQTGGESRYGNIILQKGCC